MRIGNVKVGWRFGAFATGAVVVLAVVIAVLGSVLGGGAPATNPLATILDPAFPVGKLNSKTLQTGGWLNRYIASDGLSYMDYETDILGGNYPAELGKPVSFEVYLSPSSDVSGNRSDLVMAGDGYNFTPGIFVSPNVPTSITSLESTDTTALDAEPVELAFRTGATPASGQVYQVTGMLWWRSDRLEAANSVSPVDGGQYEADPVVVVDTATQLAPAQLAAPTTQQVNLNETYEEGDEALTLQRVEYSAGNQLRVCVSVTNTTAAPVDLWPGISNLTAIQGQNTETGTADPSSAFANDQASTIPAGDTMSGYIDFPADVSNPNDQLTLQMPVLGPGDAIQSAASSANSNAGQSTDSISVSVQPSQAQPVSSLTAPTSNCTNAAPSPGSASFTAVPDLNQAAEQDGIADEGLISRWNSSGQ